MLTKLIFWPVEFISALIQLMWRKITESHRCFVTIMHESCKLSRAALWCTEYNSWKDALNISFIINWPIVPRSMDNVAFLGDFFENTLSLKPKTCKELKTARFMDKEYIVYSRVTVLGLLLNIVCDLKSDDFLIGSFLWKNYQLKSLRKRNKWR